MLLEIAIIYCAPFLLWALDLDWTAGETFLSEYSAVIASLGVHPVRRMKSPQW